MPAFHDHIDGLVRNVRQARTPRLRQRKLMQAERDAESVMMAWRDDADVIAALGEIDMTIKSVAAGAVAFSDVRISVTEAAERARALVMERDEEDVSRLLSALS